LAPPDDGLLTVGPVREELVVTTKPAEIRSAGPNTTVVLAKDQRLLLALLLTEKNNLPYTGSRRSIVLGTSNVKHFFVAFFCRISELLMD
jgi:hypothetical protein